VEFDSVDDAMKARADLLAKKGGMDVDVSAVRCIEQASSVDHYCPRGEAEKLERHSNRGFSW
jgi:hypothetical protein